VDLAGQQVLHGGRGAAIGNELERRAAQLLEIERAEMRDAAQPAAAQGRLAGIGLEPGDDVAQGRRLEGLARRRVRVSPVM